MNTPNAPQTKRQGYQIIMYQAGKLTRTHFWNLKEAQAEYDRRFREEPAISLLSLDKVLTFCRSI